MEVVCALRMARAGHQQEGRARPGHADGIAAAAGWIEEEGLMEATQHQSEHG